MLNRPLKKVLHTFNNFFININYFDESIADFNFKSFLMHTILGTGGAISKELAKVLIANQQPVKLVSRNTKPITGASTFPADLAHSRQTA